MFSIYLVFRQFFGEPIQCDAGSASDGIDGGVLNSYCWMYSTWNIPQTYKGACSAGMEFGGITLKEWQEHSVTIVYNSYYQWVPLYLIILAFLFYLPRMCWLIMEGGLMEFFGKGTTTRFVEDQEEKKDILVDFFRKNVHNKYNSAVSTSSENKCFTSQSQSGTTSTSSDLLQWRPPTG